MMIAQNIAHAALFAGHAALFVTAAQMMARAIPVHDHRR